MSAHTTKVCARQRMAIGSESVHLMRPLFAKAPARSDTFTRFRQVLGMSTPTDSTAAAGPVPKSALDEFETVYRANVGAVTAYFARRCVDAQAVGDLTSETFTQAIGSYLSFDARKGSARAWLFGIARLVYAQYCADVADRREAAKRFAGQRPLEDDEIEELAAKIDAEREGAALIERWSRLPELERGAIELVDLCGLSSREAADALGVSPGTLRMRLSRARSRLRKEETTNE
jgi:RNA polymerase sigma-70 factor (ECF subfamily)